MTILLMCRHDSIDNIYVVYLDCHCVHGGLYTTRRNSVYAVMARPTRKQNLDGSLTIYAQIIWDSVTCKSALMP